MATAARTVKTAAAPTMTWAERALYLMDEKRKQRGGLAWRNARILRWDADGKPAEISIDVNSNSIDGLLYTVTYYAHEDTARCRCAAGGYVRPCCHAGLGIWYGRTVTAMYTPAAIAQQRRDYERDMAHQGNARVLGY